MRAQRLAAAGSAWAAVTLLALAACGSRQPALPASRPAPGVAATPAAPAASLTPSPALPEVPDFAVVAYQGEDAFGGHDGHFHPVFAAGRPVVLLYFAGL